MRRLGPAVAGLLLSFVTAGCGASNGPSFDGAVYRRGPVAFRIGQVPSAWRAVDVTDASLAYRDDARGASILVNGRCHKPDDGTPLVALTNHLVIGSTMREIASLPGGVNSCA